MKFKGHLDFGNILKLLRVIMAFSQIRKHMRSDRTNPGVLAKRILLKSSDGTKVQIYRLIFCFAGDWLGCCKAYSVITALTSIIYSLL